MKKNRSLVYVVLLGFVLSMMFIGTAAASGGLLLPTPTRNPRTPPPTPTPGGSFEIGIGEGADSFDCPAGGVEGYGQVTPDALWMGLCGHCLPTTTPMATYDLSIPPETVTPIIWVSGTPATPGPHLELTYTPEVSPTPTNTPSPTVVPTQGYTCNYLNTPSPVPESTYPPTAISSVFENVVQNTSASIVYVGAWMNGTCPACSDNSVKYTITNSNYFTYDYVGTNVTVYYVKDNDRGKYDLYIDNSLVTTLDGYATTNNLASYSTSGVIDGSHQVKLVLNGKNPSSSNYYFVFDRLSYTGIVSPTPYPTYTPVINQATGVFSCPPSSSDFNCLVDQEGNHAVLTWTGAYCAAGCTGVEMNIVVDPEMYDVWISAVVSAVQEEYSNYSSNRVNNEFWMYCPEGGNCFYDWGLQLYSNPGTYAQAYSTFSTSIFVRTRSPGKYVTFHSQPAQDYPSYAGSLEWVVELWTSTQCFPNTPVPVTSTPYVGMDYCSSINNGMGDLENQDMTFWVSAGPASCLIIPSFSTEDLFNIAVVLDWLNFVFGGNLILDKVLDVIAAAVSFWQVTTPAMTICLQPYEFLPVNLFGNIMFIQTLVDIGLGIYIIDILRRK